METNISILPCYYQLKTWNNGASQCYVYTTQRTFKCSFNLDGTKQTSSISVTFSGEKKADSKLPRVTKWIQDDKGQALPETSASLWLQHYGEKAYFVYDSSMQSFTLINQEEFDTMTAEQQSYLNAPVHASV
jgi:hypothetical protein|tara:strand:+ start:1819 stop:2214 length:396 start_codon:yes stop_codon:yes gene_type:complete